MEKPATQLSHRLGRNAEAVCRHYLSQGYREGRYWLVGNAQNVPGRSLYVRLVDMEKGPAGKWTDAATGQHGDLLDLIALNQGFHSLRDTLNEARHFLRLPKPEANTQTIRPRTKSKMYAGSPDAARRLFTASKPIQGTLAEAYLRNRGMTNLGHCNALRYHPHCYYRPSKDDVPGTRTAWPALIAAVTDFHGQLTGVHRTFLAHADRDTTGSRDAGITLATVIKAPVASPRRAMGNILGHGIRFGTADDVMIAGEGLETMLSLREIMPTMPMTAATSSAHLAAILFPSTLKCLYVARDNDPAGDAALATLAERANPCGIEVIALSPQCGDFNDDLLGLGPTRLALGIAAQLLTADKERFLNPAN